VENDRPGTIPAREPRTLLVHAGVDAVVAFLALIVVGLILGLGPLPIAVAALVLGVVAAPFTRRAEVRALAERAEREERREGPAHP